MGHPTGRPSEAIRSSGGNYADFLEHVDYEAGRVVDAIEELGELDNTLVIYILGDNGSSAEGSLVGTPNELMSLNGRQPSMEEAIGFMDKWGLPGTSPHYAVGWALAGDTPFQWTKQVASHFGGTRNSMIVSWPAAIKDKGKIRSQFHHVIDVMPTLMEVVGVREPKEVNGYIQRPIEGTSFAYTFSKENAKKPSARTQQYFEMFGNRAMYSDGWMASCRHGRLPWETAGSSSFDEDEWELYNIAEDFSQSVNLAKKEPERLRRLQDLFMADAEKYNVLPLRYDVADTKALKAGKRMIELKFTPESAKPGAPAAVVLSVDGKKVATGRIDEQVPMRCGTETMDVGMDCVSPVCSDYEKKRLFPFTGTIESVTFKFAKAKQPTGMQRLELATKMD